MTSLDQSFKFALLNIRSLWSKSFYISDFISQYGLHFLFLTECWLSSTVLQHLLRLLPQVITFYSPPDNARKGVEWQPSSQIWLNAPNAVLDIPQPLNIWPWPLELNNIFLHWPFIDPLSIILISCLNSLNFYQLLLSIMIILLGDFNLHLNDCSDTSACWPPQCGTSYIGLNVFHFFSC